MTDQPTRPNVSAIHDAARPPVTDRAAFQIELDRVRVRERAHTREGDAIAAARRRLPMVEVDPQTLLTGADGPVPLIDIFDGRSQLIAYFHIWHTGRPAAEQCEGCTFNAAGPDRLRPAGILGGVAGGLAAALGFQRWPVPAGHRRRGRGGLCRGGSHPPRP